jgi:hypothetical protein
VADVFGIEIDPARKPARQRPAAATDAARQTVAARKTGGRKGAAAKRPARRKAGAGRASRKKKVIRKPRGPTTPAKKPSKSERPR